MRKRIVSPEQNEANTPAGGWLNIEALAEVEITSEDVSHPIESALMPGRTGGWRAAESGKQTIRLLFTQPQHLQRITLSFIETQTERTQEYVLRWSPDGGQTFREIARQQWNFSPQGATSELENHLVDLASVTLLELSIIPNISGGSAVASLAQMRLG